MVKAATRARLRESPSEYDQFSEFDLIKELCKESFYDFVKEFWDIVVPEDPVWNWHIEYLCKQLQIVAQRVFDKKPKAYDLIINISPGSTKSTIVSVLFPAWIWTNNQSMRTICASYTSPLALELSRKSRMVVESEKYRKVFNIKLLRDQNAKYLFINTRGGSRQAVGTGNQITGSHAHFLIVDDPIDPKGAKSEPEIKSTNEWMDETLSTRKVDKLMVPTIVIMQRLHQNDPSGHLLAKEKKGVVKIKHICLPAELGEGAEIKPERLKRFYKNGLMDTTRLSQAVLDEALVVLGPYGYAGQYLQTPIPRGGGMFKTNKIEVDEAPPVNHFVRVVRYWDKAGTRGAGCFSVGALIGLDIWGKFWILDIKRGQLGTEEREKLILQTARIDFAKWGSKIKIGLEQEGGSGGKESAENTVKRLAGFSVQVDIPRGNKEFRADPFSVQVNFGNVKMVLADWNTELINELQYFPNSTYKDQADALSAGFAILAKGNVRAGPI